MENFLSEVNPLLAKPQQDSNKTIEVEVRIGPLGHLDISAFDEAVKRLESVEGGLGAIEEERSMSILHKKKSLVIRKIFGSDPSADSIVIMRKNHVFGKEKKPLRYFGHADVDGSSYEYKIACSIEEIIQGTSIIPESSDVVRLRFRKSRIVKVAGDSLWSIDVTLVREVLFSDVNEKSKSLKIKEEFFSGRHVGATHYEVELEFKQGSAPNIALDTLKDAVRTACIIAFPRGVEEGFAKSGKDLMMRTVARMIESARASSFHSREMPTLKRLLNNAISMTRMFYIRNIFPLDGYCATEKADGERGLAIIDKSGSIAILTDTELIGNCDSKEIVSVYDGEFMIASAKKSALFFAFDCIWKNGKSMMSEGFQERLDAIEDVANEQIAVRAKKFIPIEKAQIREIVEKIFNEKREYGIDGIIFTQLGVPYFETHNYKWKPSEANTIDFLCFQCPDRLYGNAPYVLPTNEIPLSASARGRSDFRIYLLFCSCNEAQRREFCIEKLSYHNDIVPHNLRDEVIHFRCRFDPLAYILVVRLSDLERFGGDINGKVIEMRAAQGEHEKWRKWELIRERPDRVTGNNIATATLVYANIIDPFPLSALWNPGSGYFAKEGEEEGRDAMLASRKYRRYILTLIMGKEIPAIPEARILDIGGGLAQDFSRFAAAGASLVVNFDRDQGAISESVSRVETLVKGMRKQRSQAARWIEPPRVTKTVALATATPSKPAASESPFADCVAPVYIGKVVDVLALTPDTLRTTLRSLDLAQDSTFDFVVSSFSFHYFCTSRETVARMFELFNIALNKEGGRLVIITTMSGERVFKKLAEGDGDWEIGEGSGGAAKYEIHMANKGKGEMKLQDFGQMVKVSVPFSDELYEEPLCNFRAVEKVAESCGFNLLKEIDFGARELFASFEKVDKLGAQLSEEDREYSSLFGTMIFARATVKRGGRRKAAAKK